MKNIELRSFVLAEIDEKMNVSGQKSPASPQAPEDMTVCIIKW